MSTVPTPAAASTPAETKPDPNEIELVVPVNIGGKEIKKIVARRLKVSDRMAVEEMGMSPAKNEVWLFSRMLSLAPDEVELFDLADYEQFQEKYLSFTRARPSKNSAPKSS